ncbi:Pimeloyl-ACP methyl ester carboxylesterase [Mitsuaria sp. PDC51]|uniref:alpha/beta fold hydrolase n=1 Tax=Mitsuaria sp. PDC51 TaxID=1881035 RepID=UPI0008F231B2|nr:alpha/beta hydrolase [Mitsuaria sp. PDC51]SFR80925.1 Pimeloyl-ACP methyl ester carboxylesterase [Mitsuaria sp. PDC51]
MTEASLPRRRFLIGAASAATAVALPTGLSRAATAAPAGDAPGASGSPIAVSPAFGVLKEIDAGDLRVGYVEAGPADGPPVLLLHGWPYDVHTYEAVAPLLAAAGHRVIVPYARGYGTTRFLSAGTPRNGQQGALASDAIALLDALRIPKALVAGCDWGARTAGILAALWPERCEALVSVSGYLLVSRQVNQQPLPPAAELQWWYQYYFATERGRLGYQQHREAFARLIWQLASPQWRFDDATFARSAAAFSNPDHVDIVVHNYRWRLGLAEGEPRFDAIEARIGAAPVIGIPTITLEGDANGAPHPSPAAYRPKFSGRYEHRDLRGGIGHNLPQEAPKAFAQAILDVRRF